VCLSRTLELIGQLESKASFLRGLSEHVQLLSRNSLISCYQLGDVGRGLAVVADDLATISMKSTDVLVRIDRQIHKLVSALRDSALLISSSRLQVAIAIVFLQELIQSNGAAASLLREKQDLGILGDSFVRSAQEVKDSLQALRTPVRALEGMLQELAGAVRSLSRIHLIGRVEAAHATAAERFLQFFDEVNQELLRAKAEMVDFSAAMNSLDRGVPVLGRECQVLLNQMESVRIAA
jgi:methyl-accepting chemotaxis protein